MLGRNVAEDILSGACLPAACMDHGTHFLLPKARLLMHVVPLNARIHLSHVTHAALLPLDCALMESARQTALSVVISTSCSYL